MKLYKKYIDVIARQNRDGQTIPLTICWDNGEQYAIDKVLNVENKVSQVGGCGTRYICMIRGQKRYLFLEKNRWFMESQRP